MVYQTKYLTNADLQVIELAALAEARTGFWAYRQYINDATKFKKAWFHKIVAQHLQKFVNDFFAGLRPVLILEAPPQHGKSYTIIDAISYIAGLNPDVKTIYASFSDRLGIRANLRLQRIYDSERYQRVFPETIIGRSNVVTISSQTLRNREILEYVGRDGSFRNTTVNGAINGEGLDLAAIDDPVKGREAANSEAIKEKTWDWFTDDFLSRFSEQAGLLGIMTRWAVDDVIGRFIDHTKEANNGELPANFTVLKFPAIATKDEFFRKEGEALFPEHKSLEFLLVRKSIMLPQNWEALYQQNPVIPGGNMFPVDRFQIIEHKPMIFNVRASVRYWDKAATAGGGAYSVGTLMHLMDDGRFIVSDVQRKQVNAFDRERMIKQCAEVDKATWGDHEIWVEQEPGSGGLESAQRSIAMLAGFKAYKDKVTGDKETRAEPYAAQVQAGNVSLVKGAWIRDFLNEHETFPNGPYKDQVDSAAGAFMKVAPAMLKGGILF